MFGSLWSVVVVHEHRPAGVQTTSSNLSCDFTPSRNVHLSFVLKPNSHSQCFSVDGLAAFRAWSTNAAAAAAAVTAAGRRDKLAPLPTTTSRRRLLSLMSVGYEVMYSRQTHRKPQYTDCAAACFHILLAANANVGSLECIRATSA